MSRLLKNLPSNQVTLLKNQVSTENFSLTCLSLRMGLSNNAVLPSTDTSLLDFIFRLVTYLTLPLCTHNVTTSSQSGNDVWKKWIVGFASVTVINGCAAIGFMFRPLIKTRAYNIVMTFMIAMAVGSLSGSAILILIPDSFLLSELSKSSKPYTDYKWKATVVFGGVYMFFLVERFLKWIINRKGEKLSQECVHHHGSINILRPQRRVLEVSITEEQELFSHSHHPPTRSLRNGKNTSTASSMRDSFVTDVPKERKVAPVAWMIIFGDALHNFIDGLSIGAAFSINIFKGISLSLAVFCEELPHELGDFAILLNAGMTVKKALLWNLLSAATCYLGFIIGVILGEMTSSSTWVFAIAGGMFLYISLVDMMPELNALLEKTEKEEVGRFKIFLIQNLGLLFGYSIILIMAFFGDRIRIE